jgi:hypothetical protein
VELNRGQGGTGKTRWKLARRIHQLIKTARMAGLCTEFVPVNPVIEPLNLPKDYPSELKALVVNFKVWENDTEEVSQCMMPAVSVAGNAITLTSGTAGAAIWYTTDDSPPVDPERLQGSTAQLYGEPIPITQTGNFYLRCGAYLAGYLPSQWERVLVEVE